MAVKVHPDLPRSAETKYIDMAGGRAAEMKDGLVVLTALTNELVSFLKQYSRHVEVFPDYTTLHFQRM